MRIIHVAFAWPSMIVLLNGILALAQNNPNKPPGTGTSLTSTTPIEDDDVRTVDVVIDAQGVDFGPCLAHSISSVRESWGRAICKKARPTQHEKGHVAIEVAILKDGRIASMKIAHTSLSRKLD